jgi:hypothetical protein
VLVWVTLCSIAAAVVLYATSTGVGVSPDSTAYLALARGWLEPLDLAPLRGPSSSSAYFGPLYPASLAVASVVIQQDPMLAARWINAVVLPANLLLVGLILQRAVPAASAIHWLGALLFLTAPDLLVIHTMAWSEPIFLTLVMLGVLALDAYLGSEPRSNQDRELGGGSAWLLRAVTLVAAAACLQRFAGAALVLTVMVAICLWGRGRAWWRMLRASGVGAIALMPTLVWAMYYPDFRGFGVHPLTLTWLVTGWHMLTQWWIPANVPVTDATRSWIAFAALVAGGLVAGRSSLLVDRTGPPVSRLAGILGLFLLCYAIVIAVAASFWDASLTPIRRYFAPFWVSGILLVMMAVGRAGWSNPKSLAPAPRSPAPGPWPLIVGVRGSPIGARIARAGIASLALAWALATLLEVSTWAVRTHRDGQGYNSRSWQQAAIIEAIRALPEGTFLVSNGDDAIAAVAGRRAARLPDKVNPGTLVANPNYDVRMDTLHGRLKREGGLVVFLNQLAKERFYIPNEADLLDAWDLVPVVRFSEGAIYRPRSGAE